MSRWIRWALLAAACAALGACETVRETTGSVESAVKSGWDSLWSSGGGPVAYADLKPTQGNKVSGRVEFRQAGNLVHVTADLTGLAPDSEHGFHVHERGDCSAPDAMSAGGHFNPEAVAHGMYTHAPHHVGDLPNLKADAKGEVHTSFDNSVLSVGHGSGDVAGRAVIVHRDADDYKSQPAGNSGPRLACGVIVEK